MWVSELVPYNKLVPHPECPLFCTCFETPGIDREKVFFYAIKHQLFIETCKMQSQEKNVIKLLIIVAARAEVM